MAARFSGVKLIVTPGDRKYKRNLGNTTLTVLLSIPLMTGLYFFTWYPELNRKLMEASQDIVVSIFSI